MVFSSITFLFFFLPAILSIYFLSGKYKNIVLLAASLAFYSWGENLYLLLMLGSIVINYGCGRLMFFYRDANSPSTAILTLGIILNISILGFFKYANFIVENVNILLSIIKLPEISLSPLHLPIGISFFTFQAISYIVDVYRGKVEPQKSIINLGLYISLFPQLIAGPIVRYRDIAKELINRKVTSEDFAYGVKRFLYGLSKKVLLANPLALTADKIFALPFTELSPSLAWLGAICYTFQIYYDFSGYSDMAIGLGRMFGFHFLENFNYPYISNSIREFWRRWHISLSSWLRDYLYIPLGGNRHGSMATHFNLITIFLLCGLWHGASWTFIVWGLYHGTFLVLERTKFGLMTKRLWLPVQHVLTLSIIILGWVIFRSDTLSDCLTYILTMFGGGNTIGHYPLSIYLDSKLSFELSMALLVSIPILPAIECFWERDFHTHTTKNFILLNSVFEIGQLLFITLLTYFTVISLAAGVYNPFIYFRF
jgi:alginate O-acetyltransferase complex protein AlgI